MAEVGELATLPGPGIDYLKIAYSNAIDMITRLKKNSNEMARCIAEYNRKNGIKN